RAVSWFSRAVIQSARAVRRPLDFRVGGGAGIDGPLEPRTVGNAGSTLAAGDPGLPRVSTNVSGAFGPASVTPSAFSRAAAKAGLLSVCNSFLRDWYSLNRFCPTIAAPFWANAELKSPEEFLLVGGVESNCRSKS